MAKQKEPVNPFYILLVLAGIAFFLTACAYGMMTFRADYAGRGAAVEASTAGLIPFMEHRGGQLLAIELGVLAVTTLAAMGWDRLMARSQGPAGQSRVNSKS
jgi:hypothetical protein